ncbi:hypothetical protein [Meiothermus sp.]|uniref:hypothetical protein n=1 Tax=Meiothermus sp. TaxID=1955249 RepID=UPI00262517AB|nr:hypothetical protein [Meiothermus sp.]
MLLDAVLGANLVDVETLGFGAAGVLAAAVLVVSLGSGLESAFLGLVSSLSVLTGAGLVAVLVLLAPLASALGLAGVLRVGLPLDSGLAVAFADFDSLADFDGVLGIVFCGVVAGALVAGLVAVLGLDLLTGVLAGLSLVLLGLWSFSEGLVWGFLALPVVAPLAGSLPLVASFMVGLKTELLRVEPAFF